MPFGKPPICECVYCQNKPVVRPRRGENPPVPSKPPRLKVQRVALFGGTEYNRELGESPKVKMIRIPLAPKRSRLRPPPPQPANILLSPVPLQPGMLRPPVPSQPLTRRPPIPPHSRMLRQPVPQQNVVSQRAPNRPLSLSPPRAGVQSQPVPEHPGVHRPTFFLHSPPHEEQHYTENTRSPSLADSEMSHILVPFFTRRRLYGISDSDYNYAGKMIYNLTLRDFDEVTKSMEKAFVLFYDSEHESGTCAAKEFFTAAEKFYPHNHALAVVDCSQQQELCAREVATKLPIFKLYSNGFYLSTIRDVNQFCGDQIQKLMKLSPVLTQPRTKVAHGYMQRI